MDLLTHRAAGPLLVLAAVIAIALTHTQAEPLQQTAAPAHTEPTRAAQLSARLSPVATATATPPATPTLPAPIATAAAAAAGPPDRVTAGLELVERSGIYSPELDLLSSELQAALSYVSQRVGIASSAPIRVLITRDADCGFHAAAYSLLRIIRINSCDHIPHTRVVNLAAHEFIHQLAHDRYGDKHLDSDQLLMEGFATWGAGKYWLGDRSNFAEFAREYRAIGYDFPLATSYYEIGTIDGMNALYYQWASFVDHLLSTYGRERFDKLYISGADTPGSADYRGIYGKTLGVLESEWHESLSQQ